MGGSGWVSTSLPYLTPWGPGRGDAWAAEAAAQGRRGGQRIVHAGETPAPAEIAALLGVPEGDPVVVRRRLILLDDEPSELTDTYYPVEIAGGTRLAGMAKIPGGALTLLAELGHVGVLVREDVTAGMPDEEERRALGTAAGEPVLRLVRLTLDRDDRPIQVDRMVMPALRQRLRYQIRIG
ncbi:GntR family transcriptional regulator [Streptomyces sp. B4I13]|uniref:GntR family transcriptional regulator n=1 Tax=Streptomyces achromogenes TaxID=67255 RepID=A0ABU0Q143_STRAH|nr:MULTISPECIES: UTRA domain-containing protein [Streptomyces]MDQ0683548.1 GntR family transcriptional regulator [Streptomyces achromogenes]MDQ0830744.1 GntR family transcriptional regulator [Streptomyces achromogenes]MDQ0962167.1 GntR family transcriptional regulator [Streptomyces sp. B4I13]